MVRDLVDISLIVDIEDIQVLLILLFVNKRTVIK